MSRGGSRRAARIAAPSESAIQQALIEWVHWQRRTTPALGLLFAIPNGGARSLRTASRLKAEGVVPGIPDLCLPVARRGFHGLWIELKRDHASPSAEACAVLTAYLS
jgi:hypothetical protein